MHGVAGLGDRGNRRSRRRAEPPASCRDDEIVIELDRPERPKRAATARSPIRSTRSAPRAKRWSRPKLGTPTEHRANAKRSRCCWPLAAPAIKAATMAQQQVFALVIAAPEQLAGQTPRTSPWRPWSRTAARCVSSADVGSRNPHHHRGAARPWPAAPRPLTRPTNAEGDPRHHARLAARPARTQAASVRSSAATVLCAWSHPGRIHSEAAFAMLAGVAPIPANSGQVTTRYRLNRYGDRQLNAHSTPWS